jgi:hypothetical protein
MTSGRAIKYHWVLKLPIKANAEQAACCEQICFSTATHALSKSAMGIRIHINRAPPYLQRWQHLIIFLIFTARKDNQMSFGFSIGDFIAVAGLAGSISKALSDTRGAQDDYKNLIEMLESVQTSLQVVYNFLVSSSSATAVESSHLALVRGLRMEMDCCQKLMKQFLVSFRLIYEVCLYLTAKPESRKLLRSIPRA